MFPTPDALDGGKAALRFRVSRGLPGEGAMLPPHTQQERADPGSVCSPGMLSWTLGMERPVGQRGSGKRSPLG